MTFTGSIGRGDIPYTKSAMTLLNNIDVLIAGEEADKEVLRFNSGDMMGMIPPATKHYRPDLDLRTQSLMDGGYTEAMINSDRQMWGGSPISTRSGTNKNHDRRACRVTTPTPPACPPFLTNLDGASAVESGCESV